MTDPGRSNAGIASAGLRADPTPVDSSPVARATAPGWSLLVVATALVVLASGVVLGADTMWLVAQGDVVLRTGHLPTGLPFAVAAMPGWPDVPALGGLLLALLHSLGPLGLPAAQLATDLMLLLFLTRGAKRLGSSEGATAAVIAAFVVGAVPALVVVRAQLLSLLPFALLLMLLRSESERQSRRVWWLVPLVALWGNLHGAVLVGVAVSGCYLVARRWRQSPATAAGVLVALCGALLLNPAGLRTPSYYYGVFTNQTARRGILLWAPPQLGATFDVLLVCSVALLLALAVYARRPFWEYVALAGLAVATASAARNGIWLGVFSAPAAAAGVTRLLGSRRPRRGRSATLRRVRRLLPAALLTASVTLLGMASVVLSGHAQTFVAEDSTAEAISRIAAGRTVLAPEPLAESLAAAGARVWMSDPLDAFSPSDQAAYIDFLLGHGPGARRALDAATLIVTLHRSAQADLAFHAGYRPIAVVADYDIDARTG